MASEQGQEYAEKPREEEKWQDMIRRQQREGNKEEGYWHELLRSLPDEQQKGQERGDVTQGLGQEQFVAEASYEEILHEASQRAVPQQERELER